VVASPTDPATVKASHRSLAVALLIVLSAAAFASRVLPALPVVFPDEGEVRLLGFDAYYHLRHAQYAAKYFPELQRWDVGTHFPNGQRSDAAGLFDLAIASAAIVISEGTPSEEDVFRAAAWLPPLLLLLSFPALYGYLRHSLGRHWALLACAIFLLSPGLSLSRTTLGFADHHAAEILLGLLSAGGLAHALAARPLASFARRWWYAACAALPMALFAFTWVGAPIFVMLIGITAFLATTLEIARGNRSIEMGRASFRYAIALLSWLSLAAVCWPMLVMEPSVFPLLPAGCAILALTVLGLTKIAGANIARGSKPAVVAAVALGCAALAVGALLLLDSRARGLASLLVAVKTDLVAEHEAVTPTRFWQLFGPAGALALIGIPLGIRAAWSQRESARLIPISLGVLLIGLWWRSHDYGYLAAPFIAPLAAMGVAEVLFLIDRRRVQIVAACTIAALLLFPIWPAEKIRRPALPQSFVRAIREVGEGSFEAMHWLRDHSPEPLVAVDARVPAFGPEGFSYPDGSYGVLTAWGMGSFVAAVGRRPPVWSRGSDGDPAVAWLMEEYDPARWSELCADCRAAEKIRYVFLTASGVAYSYPNRLRQAGLDPDLYRDPRDSIASAGERNAREISGPRFQLNERFDRTVIARLFFEDGRGIGAQRLVYESPHRSWIASVFRPRRPNEGFSRRAFPIDSESDREKLSQSIRPGASVETVWGQAYDGIEMPTAKIFEAVEGARLTGRAPGAFEIEARLPLLVRTTGRRFEYATSTRETDDGHFELIVPYPTQGDDSSTEVVALGPYTILVTDEPGATAVRAAQAVVSLDTVRGAGTVEVDFAGLDLEAVTTALPSQDL
jgi:asparagine N-glycosylation enzyme membrane subunit Stt3